MADPNIDILTGMDRRYTNAVTTPLSDLSLKPIPEPDNPGWLRRLFGAKPSGPDPSIAEGNIDILENEKNRLVGADERLRQHEYETLPQPQAEERQSTRRVITKEKLGEIEAEIAKQSPHTAAGQAEAKKKADKAAKKAADKKAAGRAGKVGAAKGAGAAGLAVGAGMSLYNWGKSSAARPADVFIDTGQTFSRQHMDLAAEAMEAGTPIADLPKNVRDAALAMIDMSRSNPDLFGEEAAAVIDSYGARAQSDLDRIAAEGGAGLPSGPPQIGNGLDIDVAPEVDISPGTPRAEVAREVATLGERARAGDEAAIEQLNYLTGVSDTAPRRGGQDWAITAAEHMFLPEEIANLAGLEAAPVPSDTPPDVSLLPPDLLPPEAGGDMPILPGTDMPPGAALPPEDTSGAAPEMGWGAANAASDGGGLSPVLADEGVVIPPAPDGNLETDTTNFLAPDPAQQNILPELTQAINDLGPKAREAVESLRPYYNADHVAVQNGITNVANFVGKLEDIGMTPEQADALMASVLPAVISAAPGAYAGGKIGGAPGAVLGGIGSAYGLTEDVTNMIYAGARDMGFEPEQVDAALGGTGTAMTGYGVLRLAPQVVKHAVTKNPWGLAAVATLGGTEAAAADASTADMEAQEFLDANPEVAAELEQIMQLQGPDAAFAALDEAMGRNAPVPDVATETPDARVSPPDASGSSPGGRPEASVAAADPSYSTPEQADAPPRDATPAITGTLERRDGPEVIGSPGQGKQADGGIESSPPPEEASLDTDARDQEQALQDHIVRTTQPATFGGTPVDAESADPALRGSTKSENQQSAAAIIAQGFDARGGLDDNWRDQTWGERFGLDTKEGRNRFGGALSRFGHSLATTPGDFLTGLNEGLGAATGYFDEYDQDMLDRTEEQEIRAEDRWRWEQEMQQQRDLAKMRTAGTYDPTEGLKYAEALYGKNAIQAQNTALHYMRMYESGNIHPMHADRAQEMLDEVNEGRPSGERISMEDLDPEQRRQLYDQAAQHLGFEIGYSTEASLF